MSQTFDVVIIGGGAIGCTTAFFLAEEGLSVALFDKGKIAHEASWASAGMIGPAAAPGIPWYQASGMMQAPATAVVLTDLVLDTQPRIEIDQVLVDRFL